ncbi:hypothetical protein EZ428_03660 [Pedobacter frigiditerrae]|uniref:YD repeat-containing protein n=1 Tax=Pedobacter frigiditerrae TaxID=2530452 RepID=A0A4R0N227_9SPHI|nr:hypothetical protein [Pedobacter frigiditerrae]TCC93879.1 hypothetical protein EZ428_03660 [Pedobacter frigiditerrae]
MKISVILLQPINILKKNNAVEWILKEPRDKNRLYFNKDTKNKQDKDLVQYRATIFNGDTIIRTNTNFFYSSTGLLIKKSKSGSMGGNQLGTSAIVYEYKANDMVLAKSYYDVSNAGSYLAIAYAYDIDHLPIEKRAYFVRNGKADTPALYSHYLYDKGLLKIEKYEDFNDKAKKIETKIDYFYNSKQQLIRRHSSRDTLFTDEVYEYNNDQLKKHTIHTNTKIGLNKAAVVYPSPAKVPFTLEFIYEHDAFGNVITIKELLNNQIYIEKTKKLTYY